MITGDASYIKKLNRSLIIQEILKTGTISRADLSKVIALTRATVSAQVADLIDEELVVEKQIEYNLVGRKPIMLSINAEAGYALGIDLDYGQVTFTITDLLGRPLASDVITMDTTDYQEILPLLIRHIKQLEEQYSNSRYGIVGIVIGVHGLVSDEERIQYIPRLNWMDVHLKQDLEKQLGLNIYIENNSNLSAFAEYVFIHHDTDNLLCTTLHSGIGMGMMINNNLVHGHNGYAGEIGHMIVMPGGKACECGNQGCWEKYASETSLFEQFVQITPSFELTYEAIGQKIKEGQPEVEAVMEQFIYYLSIGLNNMINLYNPDVVVLDSELLRLYPNTLEKIKNHLHSRISHYQELYISSLGKKSCVLGACALAIQHFLDVPVLNLPYEQ